MPQGTREGHPLDGTSLCQVVSGGPVVGSIMAGLGSDLSEVPVVGVEPAALELRVAPCCPPGPTADISRAAWGSPCEARASGQGPEMVK